MPPPKRTAYLSAMRSPGSVLRVSTIAARGPGDRIDEARVFVATAERVCRKLRLVRSAVSMLRAGPVISQIQLIAREQSPSFACQAIRDGGSSW